MLQKQIVYLDPTMASFNCHNIYSKTASQNSGQSYTLTDKL